MGTQSSILHVRMGSDPKQKATETLATLGLSASDAVRLLFHRIAADQAFPLELKSPNAQTQRPMAEEVNLEYMADLVRLLPPEEIVKPLTPFAADLDKDAKELQAGLTEGKLPPWVIQPPHAPE